MIAQKIKKNKSKNNNNTNNETPSENKSEAIKDEETEDAKQIKIPILITVSKMVNQTEDVK